MTENITFSLETVFEEIVERGLMDGVFTEEGFHDLVDELIEAHQEVGEIHDDQNSEAYKTQLKERWPEYKARMAE